MTMPVKVLLCLVGFLSLLCGLLWGHADGLKDERDKALRRAEQAEQDLAVANDAKKRLETALEVQEHATAEAQANRKVVYRTVQKEVAQDENARNWYNAPVPVSFVRVLTEKGSSND